MQRIQAYKYELMPNGEQTRKMRQFAGACRFVYNKALALHDANYKAGGKFTGYAGICKHLTSWRYSADTHWLKDVHSQVLQQSLKRLDTAFKNFFEKRADCPTFKKRGKSRDSFRFPQGFKIEEGNSRVFLPKIGWVRYRNSRPLAGTAKNVTVSRKGERWYISVQTEAEVEAPRHPSESMVGVDLGVARFATLSDGSFVDPLNALKKREHRLRRYQRMMARKKKFSSNWKKAKAKVQKQHQKVADARADFLHKTSTTISKNHAVVVIEDLKVSNMSRSAAGTVEKPGRKVRQKAGLNKAILDQGWAEFRRQLEYKQVWRGGVVIAVPPHNTSRTCLACGHVAKENRKTQAQFECVECGFSEHADLVGSINVLAAGHAVIACGGMVQLDRPTKQEPAETAA
jgi:putative transposase